MNEHTSDPSTRASADPITTTDLDEYDRRAWALTRKLAAEIEADPERVISGPFAQTCAAVSIVANQLRREAPGFALTLADTAAAVASLIDHPSKPTIGSFLRTLATAVDRGAVIESDVAQALFASDSYTVGCPISEAQNDGVREHADLVNALAAMALRLGGDGS